MALFPGSVEPHVAAGLRFLRSFHRHGLALLHTFEASNGSALRWVLERAREHRQDDVFYSGGA